MNIGYPDEYQELNTPPHSADAEQSLIGSMFIDSNAYPKIKDTLCCDDFYFEDHRLIFSAIEDADIKKQPIDYVTIKEALKGETTQDLETYLFRLAKDTPSAANVEGYASIVRDNSIKRQLLSTTNDIHSTVFSDVRADSQDLLSDAQDKIVTLTQACRAVKAVNRTPKEMAKSLLATWQKQIESEDGELLGCPTGIAQVNNMTQGLEAGELAIVAGRPAMGKTAFAMMLEQINLQAGNPVAMLSLEMPESQLINRHISYMSGVPLSLIRNAKLLANQETNMAKASQAVCDFAKLPYYVDDTSAMTPRQVRDSVISMNNQSIKEHGKGLSLVVLDYLQLMTSDKKHGSRNLEVSEFSGALKSLAKELKVPVVALSQLSRDVEKRPSKRPVLSDLRDSGAIEQDASYVIFPFRPEVYDEDDQSLKGVGEIILAKNRNGAIGTAMAGFNGACTKWFDQAEEYGEQY